MLLCCTLFRLNSRYLKQNLRVIFLFLFKNNFLTFTCITLRDLAINMAVFWALLRVFLLVTEI